ncbi:MAG TPA: hypothetical protein V6D02_13680 [Candidatus Obscuribacterales bacterium]
MASTENLLERLRPHLLTLDDDALAIAASKGLVRRAHKELAQIAAPQLAVVGDRLTVTWPDHTVTLPPDRPLAATCTCPATDVCRHFLLSCLWLRAHALPPSAPTEAVPPAPSLAYTLDDLTRWATKTTLRDGFALLQRAAPQIEGTDPIVVRFPQVNLTCRYSAATGLAGMLCGCKARQVCAHQVAAVLAILQAQGTPLPLPTPPAQGGDAAIAVPVIAQAQTLLEQTVAIGLRHLSAISQQQFVTLAVAAQGAHLPRLALALRGLAHEIDLLLRRHATADGDRLFESLAYTYALGAALQRAGYPYPTYLAGQAQSQYDDVGTLELIGLGAYPWRSASGYGGLTVLFWDVGAQQWCSWSESRPLFHRQRFDPAQAYYQPGPWAGIDHPAGASQSCLRLSLARRNHQQRLSSSRQTVGALLRPTQPADWQTLPCCFQNWAALRHHLVRDRPSGLAVANPLDRLAILQPNRWGDRQFDPVGQQLMWMLEDDAAQPLCLRLPFTPTAQPALAYLERLNPEDWVGGGVVGSISFEQGMLYCQPIALCRATAAGESAILNLHFAAPAPTPEAPESSATAVGALPPDRPVPRGDDLPVLVPLLSHLQKLADRGVHALDASMGEALTRCGGAIAPLGLMTLAATVETLARSPHATAAAQLLKARYLCYLYQQPASTAENEP